MADNLDLQDPEKPKKKKSGGGTISMPVFIGAIIGIVIICIVFFFLFYKFVLHEDTGKKDDKAKDKKKNMEKMEEGDFSNIDESELDEEEKEFLEAEKDRKLITIERLITNPKGSTKNIIISMAIQYRPHPALVAEAELKDEDPLLVKVKTLSISKLINALRGMDEVELLNSKPEDLQVKFKEELKALYKDNKLFLREVLITEFILQ